MPRANLQFDSKTAWGVLLALCAVALFTPLFAAAKFTDLAVSAVTIIWIRYIGGVLTVGAGIIATRTRLTDLKSPQPHLHVVRVLLGSTGGMCAIYSASVMPVADAAAIGLTEGLMIVVLAALLLREVVRPGHWLAGALSAAGAYVVIRSIDMGSANTGAGADGKALWGILAALAGAFLIACEMLMIKILARRESALGVLAHVNAIAAILFAIPGIWAARSAGLGFTELAPFLLLGPLAIAAQYCNILAFRMADAAIIGPISYTWILFSALLGYIWFGEVPGPGLALGAALIVIGGIWLTFLSTGRPRLTAPEPAKSRET